MIDQDDRPVYSDVGYFTRGRSGYRAEPHVREKRDFWWATLAAGAIAAVFFIVHALPAIQ